MRHKQADEHKLLYYFIKVILNTILRKENIGQIHHKHKIRKLFNCDTTKALEQEL